MFEKTLLLLAAALLMGGSIFQDASDEMRHDEDAVQGAVAVIRPTSGSRAYGTVWFQQLDDGVRVNAHIYRLEPNSVHGFHIHQFGDLTSRDGSSLGPHFSPEGHPHGLPEGEPRHAGDMGNIKADEDGEVHVVRTFHNFSINGEMAPVLGRGVVVHADSDDGSQPSGSAGERIATGVIGIAMMLEEQ